MSPETAGHKIYSPFSSPFLLATAAQRRYVKDSSTGGNMSGEHNRTIKERRSAHRWSATERRRGGDRREGAHKDFARALPGKFLDMHGTPRERILYLVSEHCRGCDESLQADLAQALLPTLHAVVSLDGGEISEEHRLACEAAVDKCVQQNELETGRWETACMKEPEESEKGRTD
jgi:hypothetical protein